MVNQVKVAQEDIKSFFKYEKNYNECVKDVIFIFFYLIKYKIS